MLYLLPSLVSGFATGPQGQEIEGLPCAHSLSGGAFAPSKYFVVGMAMAGVTAPSGGYGCTESGCDYFAAGDMTMEGGAFIMQGEAGDMLPHGSMGIIACQMPEHSDCVEVKPGDMAPEGVYGVLTSFVDTMIVEGETIAPGPGVWFDAITEEMSDVPAGSVAPAGHAKGMSMFFVGPGAMVPAGATDSVFCPLDASQMGRRKLSERKFTLANMHKGHFRK